MGRPPEGGWPEVGPDLGAVDIDPTHPRPARVTDFLLGGSANFAVDRAAVERAAAVYPGGLEGLRADAWVNRLFLVRAVRWLVQHGVVQFLDIGAGIPAAHGLNVHDVAPAAAEEARVVYVNNDDIVVVHAHDLPAGARYVHADLLEPGVLLARAAELIDTGRPVAVLLIDTLHSIGDGDDPHGVVEYLVDALPSGSYVAISHLTDELAPIAAAAEELNAAGMTVVPRSRDRIARFFAGLELIEPRIVPVHLWRPDDDTTSVDAPAHVAHYGALGRKP